MLERITARPRAWNSGAGFTLVELIVTVSVASVLLAVAVPSFNEMIVSSRLTAQSNDMLAAINLARSEAIKRNASVTLCRAEASSTTCAAGAGVWQNWIIRTNAGAVLREGAVSTFNGTLVMRSTLTNDQVAFGPDGLARTGTGVVADHTITVCSVRTIDRNVRRVVLGVGSRMTTELDRTTACS
jgi:type IV fimbrial biogenesis protein FimT